MRILWAANFTAQSSYANQSRLLLPRLRQMGHTIEVLELGGSGNTPKDILDFRVLPPYHDAMCNDSIRDHAKAINPDVIISLTDQWALNGETWAAAGNWYPWTPIDHMPAPPQVVKEVKSANGILAMSRFGVEQLKNAGLSALYVPCAYNPALWYAVPHQTRQEMRRADGISPDTFYVSFVGVNDSAPNRKGIPELLAAWTLFHARYPKSHLHLHTSIIGNKPLSPSQGVNIAWILETLNVVRDSVSFPNQYAYRTGIPQRKLHALANVSDLFILPTRGEGFGLPLIEFQACGCPVATTAFAAGNELIFGGWGIDGELDWSWQDATALKPGITSIFENLEDAYQKWATDQSLYERIRATAIEDVSDYAIDTVIERHWIPALEQAANSYLLR